MLKLNSNVCAVVLKYSEKLGRHPHKSSLKSLSKASPTEAFESAGRSLSLSSFFVLFCFLRLLRYL